MPGPTERKWKTLRDYGDSSESAEIEETSGKSAGKEDKEAVKSDVQSEGFAGKRSDRVLLALPTASTSRLFRETFGNFTNAKVDATADPLRAFELALQRRYRLYIFAMEMSGLSGPMLYEMVSKACAIGYGTAKMAPGVIFVREEGDPKLPDELTRDARVRDVLTKPLRIDRMLESFEDLFEVTDPTQRE